MIFFSTHSENCLWNLIFYGKQEKKEEQKKHTWIQSCSPFSNVKTTILKNSIGNVYQSIADLFVKALSAFFIN